jgi:hypothetical protein
MFRKCRKGGALVSLFALAVLCAVRADDVNTSR